MHILGFVLNCASSGYIAYYTSSMNTRHGLFRDDDTCNIMLRSSAVFRRAIPARVSLSMPQAHARFLSTVAAEESPTMRRLGAVFFSSVVGGTACLCAWQTQRYQWKLQLIEERKASLHDAPQPIRDLVPKPTEGCPPDSEFRRVICEGTFDHSAQALVGPRSAPAGSVSNVPAGAAGPSGWDVITPFVCRDGTRLLVNRGWVGRDPSSQSDPAPISHPQGFQAIDGILKNGERENRYAKNNAASGRYVWLDLPAMAEATSSAPLMVVACSDAEASGSSRGEGPPKPQNFPHARSLESFSEFHVKPSTHLTYAATWAALSVAGAFITFKRFR